MRPKNLRIMGKDYKVQHISRLDQVNTTGSGQAYYAQIDYPGANIRIFSDLSKFDYLHSILHEAMHGISVALNLELNENQVDLAALGVANLLLDNKMLHPEFNADKPKQVETVA